MIFQLSNDCNDNITALLEKYDVIQDNYFEKYELVATTIDEEQSISKLFINNCYSGNIDRIHFQIKHSFSKINFNVYLGCDYERYVSILNYVALYCHENKINGT